MSSVHSFRPARLIPDGSVGWAWDPLYDAVVQLDAAGGRRRPRRLPPHHQQWTLSEGLLWQAGAETVEARGLDGSLRERWQVNARSLACFGPRAVATAADGTLWVLELGAAPLRVRAATGVPQACDATLLWVRSFDAVEAVDLVSGTCVARHPLTDRSTGPSWIDADGEALFVRTHAQRRGLPVHVIELDARTLEPRGAIDLPPGWLVLAVVEGTAIIVPRRRPTEHDELERNLFWIDARSGESAGSIRLDPRPMSSALRGEGCIWSLGWRAREAGGLLPMRIPSRPERVWTWDLADVDVSAVPQPSAPADTAAVESHALSAMRQELSSGLIDRIDFVDFRLERAWPDTVVAAVFESPRHPGTRFVRRIPVWTAAGTPSDLQCDGIDLMEDVEACGYGLPGDPQPGPDGLVEF